MDLMLQISTKSCSLKAGVKGTRRRGEKQQRKHLALEAYRLRFIKALEAELSFEMQSIEKRLNGWSRKRLENEGCALFDLSTRVDSNLFRTRVFRFFHAFGDGILPRHHQFFQGDMVTISSKEGDGEDAVEGVIMERAQRFIRVAVQWNDSKKLSSKTRWRLDLSANSVSHERCTLAVEYFSAASAARCDELERMIEAKVNHGSFCLSEAAAAVKSLILDHSGREDDHTTNVSQAVHLAKGLPARVSGAKLGSFRGSYRRLLGEMNLNTSQKAAIEAGLCQRVTLWHGPPGTGKTRSLVKFIVVHCRTGQGKVLACADSNIAVDNLLEGILEEGLSAVRIGQPVKVKEELRRVTLEAQVSSHPLMKKCMELRERSKQEQQQQKHPSKSNSDPRVTWQQAIEMEARAIRDVISRAQVVAATCVGAGDPVLDGHHFSCCVIDEATQATEPASLIPLLRSGADCFVLVGDPAQLPPTVVTKEALEAGLQVSLFEHLEECGLKPLLLNTQYRMHPALAEFPSSFFYKKRLLSAPSPSDRRAPEGFEWPNAELAPLAFVDCNGEDFLMQDNSYQNEVEAIEVVKLVKMLVTSADVEGGCSGIGIISPYNAQVRLLQDIFSVQKQDFSKLEIKSVDGFQGREKEVIVFSTVRSNDQGNLGFVSDPRRMNVALTRARRGLIVVGNSATMESNNLWRSWLKEARAKSLFLVKG